MSSLHLSIGHLISSNTAIEIGEDQIDVIYRGEEISIGFNISYLQDVIDILDSESVEICFNDQTPAVLFKETMNLTAFL